MDEYISRSDYCESQGCPKSDWEHCKNCSMARVPAADVQPVKRGKWELGRCTNCNTPPDNFVSGDYWVDYKPDFCPNCGAKME